MNATIYRFRENHAVMMTVPKPLYTNEIKRFINWRIDDGYTSFDALTRNDQETLIRHVIDAMGSDACEAIIQGGSTPRILKDLATFSFSYNKDQAHRVAYGLLSNLIEYYADYLNLLFVELIEEREAAKHDGLTKVVDQVNGEVSHVNR